MSKSIEDFINEGGASSIDDQFEQATTFSEFETPQYGPEEPPQVRTEATGYHNTERPEYESWVSPKLTPEELKAKADLETLKYSALITGGLNLAYTALGLMPEPLTPAEQQLYDDFIIERAKAKKRNETYLTDRDDPIHEIYRRKQKFLEYREGTILTADEKKILTKSIYVTLHGKNERGELGQMSIMGAISSIILAKMGPQLTELVPVATSYIKNGINRMKNRR